MTHDDLRGTLENQDHMETEEIKDRRYDSVPSLQSFDLSNDVTCFQNFCSVY